MLNDWPKFYKCNNYATIFSCWKLQLFSKWCLITWYSICRKLKRLHIKYCMNWMTTNLFQTFPCWYPTLTCSSIVRAMVYSCWSFSVDQMSTHFQHIPEVYKRFSQTVKWKMSYFFFPVSISVTSPQNISGTLVSWYICCVGTELTLWLICLLMQSIVHETQ